MGYSYPPQVQIRNPPHIAALYSPPEADRTLIALPFRHGLEVVDLGRIVRIEADGCYVSLHLSGKRPLYFAKTLKFFVQTLEDYPQFVRIHRSHMINLRYLRTLWRKKQFEVELSDGTKVPVSRRKYKELREVLESLG
jgi:two-component system LytT family response regulator